MNQTNFLCPTCGGGIKGGYWSILALAPGEYIGSCGHEFTINKTVKIPMKYTTLKEQPRTPLEPRLPLAGPLSVHFQTINTCNFSCKFCPVSTNGWYDSLGGKQTMPMDLFQGLIEALVPAGLKVARLFATGEPLLDKFIHRRIELINKFGTVRTEVTSNGTPLIERTALRLINAKLDHLRISIYKDTPASVFENIRRLCALKNETGSPVPDVFVRAFWQEDVEQCRQQLRGFDVDVGFEDMLDDYGGTFRGQGIPDDRKRKVCPMPFYNPTVMASGDFYLCCHHAAPPGLKANLIGNVKRTPILELWRGEKAKALRRQQLEGKRFQNPSCATCNYVKNLPDNLDGFTRPIDELV